MKGVWRCGIHQWTRSSHGSGMQAKLVGVLANVQRAARLKPDIDCSGLSP